MVIGRPLKLTDRTWERICERRPTGGVHRRRVDALVHVAWARLTDPNRVVGAKPAVFAYWLFDLLGATGGDLYPGSGGIGRSWEIFQSRSAGGDASREVSVDHSSPEAPATRRAEQLPHPFPSAPPHASRRSSGAPR